MPGAGHNDLVEVAGRNTASGCERRLSLAVVLDREIRYANGFGLADLENNVPAKADTVYRLGSISKPLTAVAVMQLVEQGKIDLAAPVQKYVPAFPEKQWPVTIRQLLSHQGGIRHYISDEMNSTRHYNDLTEPLKIFKDDLLLFEPGSKFSYTTYGYNLLGSVVEAASGENFPDYLRAHIWEPAGMDRIRVDSVADIIPNRAQGYRRLRDGTLRNSELADTSNKIPGGGLCSTVYDLAKFAIALESGKLVRPETRERMWTVEHTSDGQPTVYGLGWFLAERSGRKMVYHGGGQQRISTMLAMVPDRGFTVVWMCNLEGSGLRIHEQLADALLAAAR